MKSVGIVRNIDQLGRIVLPKEMRDTLDIPIGTPLEIYVDGVNLILKKHEPGCIFCGETNGIKNFKGKNICPDCEKQFKD